MLINLKESSHIGSPNYDAEITPLRRRVGNLPEKVWEHGAHENRKILRAHPQGLRARIYLCILSFVGTTGCKGRSEWTLCAFLQQQSSWNAWGNTGSPQEGSQQTHP